MKIKRIVLFGVFFLSLLVGLRLGAIFFQERPQKTFAISSETQPSLNKGGQNGIWIIIVDQLGKTTPQLKNVWLFSYIPNYIAIKPLLIYPSNNTLQNRELSDSFQLLAKKQISDSFWEVLKNHGHQVQDYIIADDTAIGELLTLYGGLTTQESLIKGQEILSQTSEELDDPHIIVIKQMKIIDSLCNKILNNDETVNWSEFYYQTKHHFQSNLDLEENSSEWQTIINSSRFTVCDFSDVYEILQASSSPK